MGHNNEFNLLSSNVRWIRTFEKRKDAFSWLVNSGVDIFFLQETYSTRDIENIWRKQWKGELFFSHGSKHTRVVLVLIRDNLDFKIHSTEVDSQVATFSWRLIFRIRLTFFLNIYAPNKCSEQFLFFKDVSDIAIPIQIQKIWRNLSVFRRLMIVCMITLHKVQSFVLGQLGTHSARE